MKDDRKELGALGEERAVSYLVNNGYRILARNFRSRLGEIDIICEIDDVIVFVEVRSKRSLRFGSGMESVTLAKQRRLRQVAQMYLMQKKLYNRNVRFDVIDIFWDKEPVLKHIQSAFF